MNGDKPPFPLYHIFLNIVPPDCSSEIVPPDFLQILFTLDVAAPIVFPETFLLPILILLEFSQEYLTPNNSELEEPKCLARVACL